ncbi:hypothetical protein C7271_07995 [filamentous cyanobacterium CCP5]|nr:hypothetical protein C7271_07995 [filamentous cyanobacterium CCP5]
MRLTQLSLPYTSMQAQSLPSATQQTRQPAHGDRLIHESETLTPCLCAYQNRTGTIQVIRIPDLPGHHFERVVFPGQRLMFHAPAEARIEVHSANQAGALLADTFTCDRIKVSSH